MKWTGNTLVSSRGSITIRILYDGVSDNKGWYAGYINARGDLCHHSELVTHPDMPRRRDAEKAALRIARREARRLLTQEKLT